MIVRVLTTLQIDFMCTVLVKNNPVYVRNNTSQSTIFEGIKKSVTFSVHVKLNNLINGQRSRYNANLPKIDKMQKCQV